VFDYSYFYYSYIRIASYISAVAELLVYNSTVNLYSCIHLTVVYISMRWGMPL